MCWHVFSREDGHILRRASDFEVEGQSMKWRITRTCKKQVEEESMKIGLSREDVLFLLMWFVGINHIAVRLR